jgi:hypothetical protein
LKIKLEEILPGDEIEERELDQKRKTMLPCLQFFPFSLHSYPGYLLSFYLQTMFFLRHFKGNSWCLMVPAMEGRKGAAPSSNLERNHC